ncbi:MAG: YggS family pyridoxal phosphate-dependent enzyme [Rickettsiales bacterium]|nr:YggS family pyridoxal phosphate-dependent enzyme [Rickettsiales bacterium]
MISENLKILKNQIAEICYKISRNPAEVNLIAVSKTKPVSDILDAIKAGQFDFGENYIQEATEKFAELQKINAKFNLHFIGNLQSNKVKYLTNFCYLFHSLDRISLAKELNKRLVFENKNLDCLLQINSSNEESKSGCKPEEAIELLKIISNEFQNIKIKGVMTIAENSENPEQIRDNFKLTKEIFEKAKSQNFHNIDMQEISMGMSGDYKIAIEEGATLLRIGSAIFGVRNSKNSIS